MCVHMHAHVCVCVGWGGGGAHEGMYLGRGGGIIASVCVPSLSVKESKLPVLITHGMPVNIATRKNTGLQGIKGEWQAS